MCLMGLVSGDSVLGVQVSERQLQAWEAAQQEEEEEEAAKQAEQVSDALLQQEARTMAEEGYRPKVGICQVTAHHSPILSSLVSSLWTTDGPRQLCSGSCCFSLCKDPRA